MFEIRDEIPMEPGEEKDIYFLIGGDFGDTYIFKMATSEEQIRRQMKEYLVSANVGRIIKCKIKMEETLSPRDFYSKEFAEALGIIEADRIVNTEDSCSKS